MAILHVKSPNGTQTNLDLNKVATTDGFTMGNEKVIKFQHGSIRTMTNGHTDGTDPINKTYNQLVLSSDPNPEIWLSGGAKLALHGYTSDDDGADGGFIILAADGTNFPTLYGDPTGKLEWGEKPIEVVDQCSYEENGYVKYKSGFIFQHGVIPTVNGLVTVVYPISFTTHWDVVLSNDGVWIDGTTISNFTVKGVSDNVHWIAMGY